MDRFKSKPNVNGNAINPCCTNPPAKRFQQLHLQQTSPTELPAREKTDCEIKLLKRVGFKIPNERDSAAPR